MQFTLRQLSYFVAAGETGSITLAAEKVHISQPSVSAAISALEASFGVQLFIRLHAQGLLLTPAGEQVLEAARDLLGRAEALQDLADEISTRVAGPLKVGVFRTQAPLLIPDLCVPFIKRFPEVQLDVVECDEGDLLSRLRKGELDICITYEQGAEDVEFEAIAQLPTYVILAADHRLAKAQTLKLGDLAQEPFILLDLPVSRDYFRSLFEQRNIPFQTVASSSQPETVRSYVAAGAGFSLLTARPPNRSALTGKPLAYIELDENFPPMMLGMATLKGARKNRALRTFEEHCRMSSGA